MTTVSTTVPSTQANRPVRQRSRRIDPLYAGMVAGPMLALVSFAQIPFRHGFDMSRHAFSFLLIGPGGWLQLINYVLTGSLFVISGIG